MQSTLFTNNGIITNDNITLEENGVLKIDPKEIAEVFNNCCINIVETTSGKRPSSTAILIPNVKIELQ